MWAAIHPTKKDHLIALERNYFPRTMDTHELENIDDDPEEDEDDVDLDGDGKKSQCKF